MRLTLRTMLAYLDGILEPEDQRELATKIEESEFATGLKHRIRQCTTRIRLSAPQIDGRGGGLDPNTVADYLDNTLPSERAPDFEKVCLESDMHLAEVAACHHVLTMVLGEPAQVDPQSRKRMYDLPRMIEEGEQDGVATAEDDGSGPADEPQPDDPKRREKLQVPDYLRGSERRPTWVIVAGVLVVVLLVVVAWSQRHTVTAMLGSSPAADNPTAAGAENQPNQPRGLRVSPRDKQRDRKSGNAARTVLPTTRPQAGSRGTGDAAGSTAADSSQPDVPPGPNDAEADGRPSEGDPTPPAKPGPPGDVGDGQPAAVVVGRYTGTGLLLRLDRESRQWVRLAENTPLSTGDRLVALPTFRPKIVLGAGVTLGLAGGTIVELVSPPDGVSAALRMVHGRLVDVMAAGGATRLQLLFGDRYGTVILGDANTMVAVDHYRYHAAGTDPETDRPPAVTDLYVSSGSAGWIGADSPTPETIAAGHRRTWMSGTAGKLQRVETMPPWIKAQQLTGTEKRGASEVNRQLKSGQPVSLVMKELIHHRKREVRSLSAECHGFVDQYKALVDAIGDERMDWFWRVRYIDSLRASISRDRRSAAEVREALEQKYGDPAGMDLYRMLYGYSPEQLQQKAAAQLVEYLGHERLAYRVMAFYNLARITGIPLNYKPEVPEIKRRQSTRRWGEKLKEGAITYKHPPAVPDVDPLPSDSTKDGGDAIR